MRKSLSLIIILTFWISSIAAFAGNTANLPLKSVLPGVGSTIGVDLENEVKAGSVLPAANGGTGGTGGAAPVPAVANGIVRWDGTKLITGSGFKLATNDTLTFDGQSAMTLIIGDTVNTNSGAHLVLNGKAGSLNDLTVGTLGQIGTTSTLNLCGTTGAAIKLFDGTGYISFYNSGNTQATILQATAPTGIRNVTFPDADSNTIQPATAPGGQFVTGISSAGVLSFAAPSGGVSSLTGDGAFITNSGSTGAVTLTLGAIGYPFGDTNSLKVGSLAGASQNNTGLFNTMVGYKSGNAITGGDSCSSYGANSLITCTNCSSNSAFGINSLKLNNGNFSTAAGAGALLNATGSQLTAVGASALGTLTSGVRMSALGYSAGGAAATSDDGTFMGFRAGDATTSSRNSAFGSNALGSNALGDNTAIGQSALFVCTGSSNSALGSNAGLNVAGGTDNTIIGTNAAATLETGSNNVVIGSGVDVPFLNTSGMTVIGLNSQIVRGLGDNTTVNGGTSGDYVWSQPERGGSYKVVNISFSNYKNTGTKTITFPAAFTRTPDVFIGTGGTVTLAGFAATTTTATVPDTSGGAATATVMIVGM